MTTCAHLRHVSGERARCLCGVRLTLISRLACIACPNRQEAKPAAPPLSERPGKQHADLPKWPGEQAWLDSLGVRPRQENG